MCQVDTRDEWDGSVKPTKKEHVRTIKKWCYEKGLPNEKVREFLRINNLAHWNQVTQLCSVQDMIENFIDLWKKLHPDEYAYECQKRADAERRAEEDMIRRRIENE